MRQFTVLLIAAIFGLAGNSLNTMSMADGLDAEVTPPSTAKLSQRDQRLAIHSIASTYRSGDLNRLLSIVRKSLARRSVDDVLAIDSYLERRFGTSLSAMVWRSRKRLSQAGNKLPPPITIEAFLMSRQLAKSLDDEIDEIEKLDIMADPLEDTKDFLAYRDLVWEHHVHSNEIANLQKFAQLGIEMSKNVEKTRSSTRDRLVREELAKYDFKEYSLRLHQLKRELDERAIEVRVNRVRHAVAVLEDKAAGTTDRFFAAYAIGVDSDFLAKKLNGKSFNRPLLQNSSLADESSETFKRGEEAGGDLIEKSRWLFAGLHWWRRGRYGVGSEAFGLLKSQAAMRDPKLKTALMMPKSTPIPTDPMTTAKSVPTFRRRHLHVWAYEDRTFVSNTSATQTRYANSRHSNRDEGSLAYRKFDGVIDGKFW